MNTINIDVATAYNKFSFLGNDFLLWLWYLSSKIPHMIKDVAGAGRPVEVTFGNSIKVEVKGSMFPEKLTIQGMDAGFEEAFIALDKGGSIVEANLVLGIENEGCEFRFTLKGEDLSVRSLKSSCPVDRGAQEDQEGAFIEKQYINSLLFTCLDRLYADFIKRRLSENWSGTYLTGIRKWVSEKVRKEA